MTPGSHELATLEALAREIASIKGCAYAGMLAPGRERGTRYLVPRDTLCGEEAVRLNVTTPDHLFGGAVRDAHVATKIITHPLVRKGAHAPRSWSDAFARRVEAHVLYGYSAFTSDDAMEAVARVLAHGEARIKPADGIGGRGQSVVGDLAQARRVLSTYETAAVHAAGVVVEANLNDVDTLSVGHVQMDDVCVSYYGTQCQTTDLRGESVYGGSALTLVRGGFDALLDLGLDAPIERAVRQAMRYDTAALEIFEGFIASRRNYDVVIGRDGRGDERSGVLEQSWRAGGASGAELLAIRALKSDRGLGVVRAATVEVYGECAVPAGATVLYRGEDARNGFVTKYCTMEEHGIVHRAA